MTTRSKKPAPKLPPRGDILMWDERGFWQDVRAWRLFRFLLDDGTTADVMTMRDDSDIRGDLVKVTGRKISGSVEVKKEQP